MLKEYFGIDLKGLSYFSGVTGTVAVVITGLYWGVFGFDTWSMQMQQASDLMAAGFVAGQTQPYAGNGGIAAMGGQTGQFVCSRDGAVGLPHYDVSGLPHCPVCGQTMMFNASQAGSLSPVAGTMNSMGGCFTTVPSGGTLAAAGTWGGGTRGGS